MSSSRTVEVLDVPERSRYEAHLGGELAGVAEYTRAGDVITFVHTGVEPSFEGGGVGSALVRTSLDAARAAGHRVVPECPFYASWIAKHPDYDDLVVGPS